MLKKEVFEQEYSKNYERGIINPREFYKIFYFFLKMGQVLDGPIPIYTYVLKAILMLAIFIALGLLSLSFYHGLENFDVPFLTESGTYIVVLSYMYLMMACTKLHVTDYHNMQRAIQEDFLFFCTRGEKYRKIFFLHQLETRKIYNISFVFTTSVGIGMNFFSIFFLLLHLATHAPGEGTRPLLFPLWYSDNDLSKTPTYEILFVFIGFCVFGYSSNYTFMFGTQLVWIRYISCKADIVISHLKDVMDGIQPTCIKGEREAFDNLIRQRMKEVMQHYNKMDALIEQYARVHKKLLMFEQTFSSPVVCLTAYSIAEKLDEGEFHVILVILFFAVVILIFLPCYLCTAISDKVNSISHACWGVPFWNAGPVIRPYLVLIIQKSLRPLPLKVSGFQEFSVQTFSSKMSSAYSFFNMLRQANK